MQPGLCLILNLYYLIDYPLKSGTSMTHNTVKDILSEEALRIYVNTPYPFNLQVLKDALELKLKEDPDYEVFAPFTYYKSEAHTRDNQTILLQPYKIFISNKGNILSLRNKEPKFFSTAIDEGGYVITSVRPTSKASNNVMVHRAIACTFMPIPKELGPLAHPKNLQVNHKDGDKTNFDMDNLEWTTSQGNVQHSHDTGLAVNKAGWDSCRSKPMKGTVVMGPHKGFEFVLCGKYDFKKYNFSIAHANRCANGIQDKVYGCVWSFVTPEEATELPKEVPTDVLESLSKVNTRVKYGIIATNVSTGQIFEITGGVKELESLGFIGTAVSRVIKGKASIHKGHTFKKVALENAKMERNKRMLQNRRAA